MSQTNPGTNYLDSRISSIALAMGDQIVQHCLRRLGTEVSSVLAEMRAEYDPVTMHATSEQSTSLFLVHLDLDSTDRELLDLLGSGDALIRSSVDEAMVGPGVNSNDVGTALIKLRYMGLLYKSIGVDQHRYSITDIGEQILASIRADGLV